MPEGYRVELSPNNRAFCKNKECKDAGVKIMKGELRFASLFHIKEQTSWAFKHWGCVTPQQIENVVGFIDGDKTLLEGYDELPEEDQERIDYALEHGHVHDEEWKGDVEVNRPGQKGFRVKTKAVKKKAAKKGAEEGEEEEGSPKPQKKRGRAAKDTGDADAPAPKKRGRGKKTAVKDDEQDVEDSEEDNEPQPKKRGRGKKTAVKDEEEDEAPAEENEPQPKKRGRGKKVAVQNDDEEVGAEHDEEIAALPPKKRGRAKKASQEIDGDDENGEDEVAVKPKKSKGKKGTATAADGALDAETQAVNTRPSRGGGRRAVNQPSYAEAPSDEDDDDNASEAPKTALKGKKASVGPGEKLVQKKGRKKKVVTEDE
ncbi:zf-PARP-domain-containing protein [Sporormia fimetaria CBS 119925]|uniref:Zf-PARP-domain-containing protein n=1 Tax=Sporormia fimetaria CBS 119925 TaxID=1340428 RepID=A0A6A6VDP6_9PLEO|nr:zf-PARP-domain-containing protein [Sporormia fimetaria CBS 119925]